MNAAVYSSAIVIAHEADRLQRETERNADEIRARLAVFVSYLQQSICSQRETYFLARWRRLGPEERRAVETIIETLTKSPRHESH